MCIGKDAEIVISLAVFLFLFCFLIRECCLRIFCTVANNSEVDWSF